MALRSKSRNAPELLPHFNAASVCSAAVSGWQVYSGGLDGYLQGPTLALTWIFYWLVCLAAIFAVMAVWDCWLVPKACRRYVHTNVPPAVMRFLALLMGCLIPYFGMAL